MAIHPLFTGSSLAVLSLPLHFALPAQTSVLLAALTLALIAGVFTLPAQTSVLLAALTLALIAGVYLGFAFVRGRLSVRTTELVVALAFTGAALTAAMSWPAWVAVGIAAHGLWDWARHRERVPTRMPRWYVPFCAIYDWIYAAGLLSIWWMRGVLA